MRELLVFHQTNPRRSSGLANDPYIVALLKLRTRHDRAIEAHTGRFPLGLRLYQQILQVDRIQTPGPSNSEESTGLAYRIASSPT